MSEYIFRKSAAKQHAEFTSSVLNQDEQTIVNAVVNWKNPNKYIHLIQQVNGRSIVLRCPSKSSLGFSDYMDGNYDGLQIFGVGGNLHTVYNGIKMQPNRIEIHPCDEQNHAKDLSEIIEMHEIDEDGFLRSWSRFYAPLHGMDMREANNRKFMTEKLRLYLENYEVASRLFTIPEFVADGFFPEKRDLHETPLSFQVYRVPLIERFPNQYFHTLANTKLDTVENSLILLAKFSFTAGLIEKTLHELGLAYIDGHIGNMSYLSNKNSSSLYITDLGSIKDISQNKHASRYYSFDVYSFMRSLSILLEEITVRLVKNIPQENVAKDVIFQFLNLPFSVAIAAFYSGYFKYLELEQNGKFSTSDIVKASENETVSVIDAYSKLEPKEFIEFFEEILAKK